MPAMEGCKSLSIVSLIMITVREVVAEDAADITALIHQLGYSMSAEQTWIGCR
jgi:hypothetical protein